MLFVISYYEPQVGNLGLVVFYETSMCNIANVWEGKIVFLLPVQVPGWDSVTKDKLTRGKHTHLFILSFTGAFIRKSILKRLNGFSTWFNEEQKVIRKCDRTKVMSQW